MCSFLVVQIQTRLYLDQGPLPEFHYQYRDNPLSRKKKNQNHLNNHQNTILILLTEVVLRMATRTRFSTSGVHTAQSCVNWR